MAPSNQAVRSGPVSQSRVFPSSRKIKGTYTRGRKYASNWSQRASQGSLAVGTARASDGQEGTSAQDQIALLREENAVLRQLAAAALEKADEHKRLEFAAAHAELQHKAALAGEDIPAVLPELQPAVAAPVAAVVQEAKLVVETPPPPAEIDVPQHQTPSKTVIMEDHGVKAVVEVEKDDTLVFKFEAASSDKVSAAVSNASRSSSMAVDPSQGSKALPKRSRSSKTSARKGEAESSSKTIVEDEDGSVVFRFETPTPSSSSSSSPAAATSKTEPTAATPTAAAATATEEPVKKATTKRRSPSATKKSQSASETEATAVPKKSTAKKVDPFAAAKATANAEASSHSPATVVTGREDWLYFR